MSRSALPDDLAVEKIKGREQGRCAVTFVVMGHRLAAPLLHRQAGLRAIKGLNRGFFVDGKYQGLVGRIQVQADDVANLFSKLWIVRYLEGLDSMRPQTMLHPDSVDRRARYARPRCHRASRPLRCIGRRGAAGRVDDLLHLRDVKRMPPRRTGSVLHLSGSCISSP